jgi:hypothetical protein
MTVRDEKSRWNCIKLLIEIRDNKKAPLPLYAATARGWVGDVIQLKVFDTPRPSTAGRMSTTRKVLRLNTP